MSQVKVRKAAGIYQKIEAIVLVFERPMDKIARVVMHFCGEQAIMDVVGSVMTEQGISFAVVQVHAYTVETQAEAEDAIQSYSKLFPGLPVVLMAVGGENSPTYWGRQDLANFMAHVPSKNVPWRRFSFAQN
jgi:hypothetical protein